MVTRDKAIKYFSDEIMYCRRAPALNGCEMREDWQETIDVCDMAIDALREQEERRWIPVTERLPEIGRKCLIANGEIVKIGWIRPDGVWKTGVNHNDLWGRFSLYPPTHWMPLPEPPKEDA